MKVLARAMLIVPRAGVINTMKSIGQMVRRTVSRSSKKFTDLLRRLRTQRDRILKSRRVIKELEAALAAEKEKTQLARAQLCQLRVEQETLPERTGFMVSAFIPDGALSRLTDDKVEQFTRVIADALVLNAVKGIRRVNQRGNMTTMIFVPVGHMDKRTVMPVFESGGKYVVEDLQESGQ